VTAVKIYQEYDGPQGAWISGNGRQFGFSAGGGCGYGRDSGTPWGNGYGIGATYGVPIDNDSSEDFQ
jgi:hypothetical protein